MSKNEEHKKQMVAGKKCKQCQSIIDMTKAYRGLLCHLCYNKQRKERSINPLPKNEGICKQCNKPIDYSKPYHGKLCQSCTNIRDRLPKDRKKECRQCKILFSVLSGKPQFCPECRIMRDQISYENAKKWAKKQYHNTKNDPIIKEKKRVSANKTRKKRRANDPNYVLRDRVSLCTRLAIKNNGGKKKGSILKYLPYTIQELREHIESLFEPWMNWSNWGMWKLNEWKDDDQTTWKWQLDHILPHSSFHYISMEDQAFIDCWALSNLRPLSAKENNIKRNKIL